MSDPKTSPGSAPVNITSGSALFQTAQSLPYLNPCRRRWRAVLFFTVYKHEVVLAPNVMPASSVSFKNAIRVGHDKAMSIQDLFETGYKKKRWCGKQVRQCNLAHAIHHVPVISHHTELLVRYKTAATILRSALWCIFKV